jgi:hypothetical protein
MSEEDVAALRRIKQMIVLHDFVAAAIEEACRNRGRVVTRDCHRAPNVQRRLGGW